MKKLTAVVLASLLLTQVPLSADAKASAPHVTRDELVTYLLDAADAYNPKVTKEGILKGYESLKGDQSITRLDAMIMMSRAFGDLPTPVGNDVLVGNVGAVFKDVSGAAQQEIVNLSKAGVLTGYPDGKLGAADPATMLQVETLVKRIYALEASTPRDDFYAYVNKDWLQTTTIPDGQASVDAYSEIEAGNNAKLTGILKDLVSKPQVPNSNEQKLADFYKTAMDESSRNKQGIMPIASYLDQIDKSSTLSELFDVSLAIHKETAIDPIFVFQFSSDLKDSTKRAVYLAGHTFGVSQVREFWIGNPTSDAIYVKYLTKLLLLSGESEQKAAADAEKVYTFEKQIVDAMMKPEEVTSLDQVYNPYSKEQLADLFKSVDMNKLYKEYNLSKATNVIVMEKRSTALMAKSLSEQNLDVLKAYVKANLLKQSSTMLSQQFGDALAQFQAKISGIQGTKSAEETALELVKKEMSASLGDVFAQKYFTDDSKQEVEQMINKFKEVYKQKLTNVDWLAETTKAKALEKLDKLQVRIGNLNQSDNNLDGVSIQSYEHMGSLFANIAGLRVAEYNKSTDKLSTPMERNVGELNSFDTNAMYIPMINSMEFPAGILQAPFYDPTAKYETNLGAIGVIIAHEITHAFDTSGSQFDAYGNIAEWWSQKDLAAFQAKCDRVVSAYNGSEVIPGVYNNGQLTLNENVADNGGMSAALEVMSQMENPDYKAFFESWATAWRFMSSKEYTKQLTLTDTHSASKIRVNRTVANFPEFYKAYGITEKDGMYVAPEDRVHVW